MNTTDGCLMVIFGASGDLTKRKLIPALFNLFRRNLLPDYFAVLGVSRTEMTDAQFREKMIDSVSRYGGVADDEAEILKGFADRLYYQAVHTNEVDDYSRMKSRLQQIDRSSGTNGNYISYLSTPPSLFEIIATSLGRLELNKQNSGWRRCVIEKPFGYDLESARKLNSLLHGVFEENQIYRIDHYLGKETVQNVMVLRFANGIFEPLWNHHYISHVEITSAEHIGVEDRGGYYDRAGVIRDMFQNHLMQLVGMIAMEPPARIGADSVRNETVKVFEALRPIPPDKISTFVVRGQYAESKIKGKAVPAYRDEKGVATNTTTPTYFAVKFYIDNWRWANVPFYVRTGKRLPTRVTEAVIYFKQTPHHLFGEANANCNPPNQLIIRIQPDEGILLKFNMKLPGGGFEVKSVNMDFHYSELNDSYLPQAYERLLLDAILGDATLYARSDAVEACWRFVDPILNGTESGQGNQIFSYRAGTWGPIEASDLYQNATDDWRYPCKDLAQDGEYCEL